MKKKPIIMIVDDEKVVLDSLKTELKEQFQNRYLIETAEGGYDALELFRELIADQYEIPVVVSDYIMPDLKGDDLLRYIHEFSPETKKIMLTGQADVQAVANAVNYAMLYRFIGKPWNKEDLALTIQSGLNSYYDAKYIEEQNNEIRELNKNLDIKVQERTKELVEALAAKNKFFSIISHDLKNPLSILLTSEEMLLEYFDSYEKEEIKDLVEKMHVGTKRISDLLLNLLSWSRSQTGNIPFNPGLFNLNELLLENKELLASNAENKRISIELELNPELSNIFADKNMINTVVRNLLSNAIKFTPVSGKVSVKSMKVNDHYIISISDNGVGISPENQEKLFKVGKNFSTKGTEKETGTGLGLLLCKEFIEKHNGKIWVESLTGVGSTFLFSLSTDSNQILLTEK